MQPYTTLAVFLLYYGIIMVYEPNPFDYSIMLYKLMSVFLSCLGKACQDKQAIAFLLLVVAVLVVVLVVLVVVLVLVV